MTYYVGNEFNLGDILGTGNSRYFYGLQRLDDGSLYFYKVDQLTSQASLVINNPGPANSNYDGFEYGVDFFDGRSADDHTRPFPNLVYDQYRWDARDCYYYIDSNGNLVVRTNKAYTYPPTQVINTD